MSVRDTLVDILAAAPTMRHENWPLECAIGMGRVGLVADALAPSVEAVVEALELFVDGFGDEGEAVVVKDAVSIIEGLDAARAALAPFREAE